MDDEIGVTIEEEISYLEGALRHLTRVSNSMRVFMTEEDMQALGNAFVKIEGVRDNLSDKIGEYDDETRMETVLL